MESLDDISLIQEHIEDILVTINGNPVTNVVSAFARGKTTKLPLNIAKAGNRISVVVASQKLAISLTNLITSDINGNENNNINENANIEYISADNMKKRLYNLMRNKQDFNFTDILMLDINDIDSDNYIIMLLWLYYAEKGLRVPRLLIVSNQEIFSELFDIKVYKIESQSPSIEIRYYYTNYPLYSRDTNNDNNNINNITDLVYNSVISKENRNGNKEENILIYASNKLEIESLINRIELLELNIPIINNNLDLIYLDGNKIIITDTLITVPNVNLVIDMMTEFKTVNSLTGGIRYKKSYISKQQADIRTLKASGGLCYRMVTEEFFNNSINNLNDKPVINKTKIIMELVDNGLDPLHIVPDIQYEYELMIRLGVIGPTGKLTDIGKFIKPLPYGLRQGVALYNSLTGGNLLFPIIIILSMIDIFKDSYYIYDLEYNLADYQKEYFMPFAGKSDIHTYCNIWNIMIDEIHHHSNLNDVKVWCEDNSINYSNMEEVINLSNTIMEIIANDDINDIRINDRVNNFNTDELVSILGPVLANIYSDRQYYLDTSDDITTRYMDKDLNYYKIDDSYSVNTINTFRPNIIYGLVISTIKSKYSDDFNTIPISLVI